MKYLVVYEKTETGYSAYLPDLPGCVAAGGSKEEVEENIREAICLHVESMKADGETLHPPEALADYQDVRY